MSSFTTPPRGRGKHWSETHPPTWYERGQTDTSSGQLPRIEDPYPADDLVDSNPGLYRVTVPGEQHTRRGPPIGDSTYPLGPEISQDNLQVIPRVRARVPVQDKPPADLVVPRVYLEPDESMDRLRQRALRWAISRDLTVILIGGYLVFRWMLYPLWLLISG